MNLSAALRGCVFRWPLDGCRDGGRGCRSSVSASPAATSPASPTVGGFMWN